MQVVCIGSTGSGKETGTRPRGQGSGKTAHAASILAESTLAGAEHATNFFRNYSQCTVEGNESLPKSGNTKHYLYLKI